MIILATSGFPKRWTALSHADLKPNAPRVCNWQYGRIVRIVRIDDVRPSWIRQTFRTLISTIFVFFPRPIFRSELQIRSQHLFSTDIVKNPLWRLAKNGRIRINNSEEQVSSGRVRRYVWEGLLCTRGSWLTNLVSPASSPAHRGRCSCLGLRTGVSPHFSINSMREILACGGGYERGFVPLPDPIASAAQDS